MKKSRITLDDGSGGQLTHDLIKSFFLPPLRNPILGTLDDAAVIQLRDNTEMVAFTTDSYVVKPLFFPGGDIGKLAVCGTVNDLAMVGAIPLYLSISFIIEEGFAFSTLRKIVDSIRGAADEAGIKIVTGDTKVVEKGSADGLFINTTGIGRLHPEVKISGSNAQPGDRIILSGPIGNHGLAVLLAREDLGFSCSIESDIAPLNHMVQAMIAASRNIHVLRDPTRGGLGTVLNEIAQQSNLTLQIIEEQIPILEEVAAACEILGYDPLYLANEGKLVACVSCEDAEEVLQVMRQIPYGRQAAIIGEVLPERKPRVIMKTKVGGSRIVNMLFGQMLPRIC